MKDEDVKKIVSDIKKNDLEETATFTDLVSKRQYKKIKKHEEEQLEDNKEISENTTNEIIPDDISPKSISFEDSDNNDSSFGIVVSVIGLLYLGYYIGFNKFDDNFPDVLFIVILSILFGFIGTSKGKTFGYVFMGILIIAYIIFKILIYSNIIVY